MKRKIFSILFALVLVLSFSLIPAVPAMATSTTTTLSIPDNVYRPAPFDVSGTTTNDGTAYTNVRFNITVSGPEAFPEGTSRADIFEITQVVPGGVQGINETFVLVDGDFVGYWGPPDGFPLPASYSATSTFTIQMTDGGTAPVGNYQVTVELVDLTPEPDITLASATDGFSLSVDTLYVGAGQQFTTIQDAIDAAAGTTIIVAAGTYPENVVIGKANLTLQSETMLGAIIQPTTTPGWPSAAVLITADGVTVDGFEIDGNTVAKNGILGWETSGLTIKNNKIHGAVNAWDGCGILLFSWGNGGTVYDNLIQDNEVYDTGRMGIMVMDHGATYSVTYGNTITGNTVHDVWKEGWGDHGGGIQINVGKDCAITNNEVYDVRNGQRGIYMFGSAAGNTITGNTLRNNHIGIQIWISGEGGDIIDWSGEEATSPEVRYNEIYGNITGAISTNVVSATPMVLDAIYNWWGDVSGPLDTILVGDGLDQYNSDGLGDPVSEYVLYDPWIGQGGMVTGGGWIYSPAGAYTTNPELEGKATFGFVSMYKKGAAVPTGKTQFNFQVADLNFHSDSYDWLVIAGTKAMYKGTGTINGAGNYGFMLSAIDSDIDKFRIKIWDKAADTVIYDNGVGGPGGTELGGGRIVIHKK